MLHLNINIPLPEHREYTYRELGDFLQQVIYREFFPDTNQPCEGEGYCIYSSYDPASLRVGSWSIESDEDETEDEEA